MIQDNHQISNIRMWSISLERKLVVYSDHFFRSTSRWWSFLFKVALIVTVFFVVKSFLSGGNRTGGVRPMSAGPDHRPPGKFE